MKTRPILPLRVAISISILALLLPAYISAQESLVPLMLDVPAPPAAKADAQTFSNGVRPDSKEFYSHLNQPADDAPMEVILRYWEYWNTRDSSRRFTIRPSDTVARRILSEVEKNPELLTDFLNILSVLPSSSARIQALYDDKDRRDKISVYRRWEISEWLKSYSSANIGRLESLAKKIKDSAGYLTNQEALLDLARLDWGRAEPIAEALAGNDEQPISQTLGQWVLYQHAVEEGDPNEAASYRRLLQETVENRDAQPGNRDLAFDALVRSGDFSGRDDWYISLFDDESLFELRVNGRLYTGLTTMINHSPPERFIEPMVELVSTNNKKVRTAVVRNLVIMLETNDPRVITALLPWLTDEDWVHEYIGGRETLITALTRVKVPESVPGLIALLDEQTRTIADEIKAEDSSNEELVERARQMTAALRNEAYSSRLAVVNALARQEDIRAADSLRRLLPLTRKDDRKKLVSAIYASDGYSSADQVAALETIARKNAESIKEDILAKEAKLKSFDPNARFARIEKSQGSSYEVVDSPTAVKVPTIISGFGSGTGRGSGTSNFEFVQPEPFDPAEIVPHLANSIAQDDEPSADFLSALARRIQNLETREKYVAAALRSYMLAWKGRALYSLLLSDLAAGKADIETAVKLLANREPLRKDQIEDILEVRGSKSPVARSIAVCMLGDDSGAKQVLDSKEALGGAALYSCARLVRMELPFSAAAESLNAEDPLLVLAASRYLESVDSAAARQALWASAPDQGWILGARHFFGNPAILPVDLDAVRELFLSVGHSPLVYTQFSLYQDYDELEFAENKIRKELIENEKLRGIYWYDGTFVKVFEDSIELLWEKDPARYRTRQLKEEEYNAFRKLAEAAARLEDSPYLDSCNRCHKKQLVMAGRQGGRRVFVSTDNPPPSIVDIENLLSEFKNAKSDLRYWAETKIAGLEVVFADERLEVVTISGSGEDRIVLLRDSVRFKELSDEIETKYREDLYDSEVTYAETERRNKERRENLSSQVFSWHILDKNGVGEITNAPVGFDLALPSDDYDDYVDPNTTAVNATTKIIAAPEGLFVVRNSQPQAISTGSFYKPVIDKKGSKAIVLSVDKNSPGLFILDLATGRLAPVRVPDNLKYAVPVRYFPQVGMFLISAGNEPRKSGFGLSDGKPFLLDPSNGSTQKVTGDLTPLLEAGDAELQTAGDGRFWAALKKQGGTSVGTISLADFSFKETLFVPWISFTSTGMYVDDAGKSALVIYNGQLVRVPLRK